jgi:hypothetical protein
MDLSPLPSPARVTDEATGVRTRAELKRQYKEAHPPMGVYAIRNLATGRCYVQASMNVHAAMNRDRFELGFKGHRNPALQRDWLAHGADHFRFEVLDLLKKREVPGFDYKAELASTLALWREELQA